MNETHQQILDFVEAKAGLSEEDKAAFLKLVKEDISLLDYVDLRVPGRVYYKLQTN